MKKILLLLTTAALISCHPETKRQPQPQEPQLQSQPQKPQPQPRIEGGGYYLRQGELYPARGGDKISRRFYFELDSAQPQATDMNRLLAHGMFIKSRPEVKVRIVGHGDVRGSREYNMILGSRRALNIAKFLLNHGVANSQISSYGEERPLTGLTREETWRKSRRVEIFY